MSFWSRVKNRKTRRNETPRPDLPKSQTCPALAAAGSGGAAGPLTEFLRGRDAEGAGYRAALENQKSRLSKTLKEFLHDPTALGYLIQYLEARDAKQLVKFWLDVETFRCSATAIGLDGNLLSTTDTRLECVPEVPDGDEDRSTTPTTEIDTPTSSDTADGCHQAVSESAESCDSGYSKSEAGRRTPDSQRQNGDQRTPESQKRLGGDQRTPESSRGGQNGHHGDDTWSQSSELAAGSGQSDSGGGGGGGFSDIFRPPSSKSSGSSAKTSLSSPVASPSHPAAAAVTCLRNRTEDAVNIYTRYIAPDSSRPVHLSTELKKDIVENVCDESGTVSPHCFDQAQLAVEHILQTEYFGDFLHSEYNAKHQVDVLTEGKVELCDILFNDTALFHFMEFMEGEGQRPVVEFWMAANNFQQSLERHSEEDGTASRPSSVMADNSVSQPLHNSISQPHQDSASQLDENSASQLNESSASQLDENSASQLNESSASQLNENSVSQPQHKTLASHATPADPTCQGGNNGAVHVLEHESTLDAMVLYDKFFSMQATSPLGFDDRIRLEIENNICQEAGPGVDCFARPLELIASYMENNYLDKFLNSKLFQNYVKELISTIQTSPKTPSQIQRSHSVESISSCGSDSINISRVSGGALSRVYRSTNTLLASGGKLGDGVNLSIDSHQLSDPDSLWRRKPVRNNVGRVDSLGRYCPGWEEAPDTSKPGGVLRKAARVLKVGGGEERSRLKEELAWQVAEMFVKDVTSITMSPDTLLSPCSDPGRHSFSFSTSHNNNNNNSSSGDSSHHNINTTTGHDLDLESNSSCSGGSDFGLENLSGHRGVAKSRSHHIGLGYF